jgi:hypothetical protein
MQQPWRAVQQGPSKAAGGVLARCLREADRAT